MTAWIPEWRITVGSTVYTTVQQVNLTTGRNDINRQCQAGYARMEIVNTTGVDFDIDVTDILTLELKDSTGTYTPVFGGTVSDFSISVKTPSTTGYITMGTVLAVGALAKLPKAIYTSAVSEALDGAQISVILQDLLINNWNEVAPALTWATYDPTTTWANAENVGLGEIDAGLYSVIALAAEDRNTETTVYQIANSAIGQIYEDKQGRISYADADHRENYLNTNGYTQLDSAYAYPSSIKTILQIGKIRNSEIVNYGTNYNSQVSDSDDVSIANYGRYQIQYESNIKHTADAAAILNRDLILRSTPQTQLDSITFRLDDPNMSSTMRDNLINAFFGEPIQITNLPANMFGGSFNGFLEGYTIKASPSYVDVTLNVSPAAFSLPVVYGNYTLAQTIVDDGVTTYTVPSGVNQIAVFAVAYGGAGSTGGNGSSGSSGIGGSGGGGGGAVGFWNYDVVPAQTYSVNLDISTRRVSFGSLISVSGGANGSTGGGSAASGGLYSKDAGVVYYAAASGTPSGAGGAAVTGTANGNTGQDGFGAGTTLTVPANIGLPTNIKSGAGGGGGGSGAKGNAGSFLFGGSGGAGAAASGGNSGAGGQGGNAEQDASTLGGITGENVLYLTGNGGGGGGGGGFQTSFGSGNGAAGGYGSIAVVYIYTR